MQKIILLIFLTFISFLSFASETDIDFKDSKLISKKNGKKVYKTRNGTIITRYKKYDEAKLKNGIIIKKYKNRTRTIIHPDGKKILIDNNKGTRTYIFKNGQKKEISMNARTPYGDQIEEVIKGIQKKPIAVILKYDSLLSDELFDGDIKYIFNQLYSELRKRVIRKHYTGKERLKVTVSYCRFCRTGYCYERPQMVVIKFLKEEKFIKKFQVNPVSFIKIDGTKIKIKR